MPNYVILHAGKNDAMDYLASNIVKKIEVVYMTIGNPAFCLFVYLIGIHLRGELQHVRDVSEQKIKC